MPTYIAIILIFASASAGCLIGCIACSNKIAEAKFRAAVLEAVVRSVLHGLETQEARWKLANTCRVALENAAEDEIVVDFSIRPEIPVYAVGDK